MLKTLQQDKDKLEAMQRTDSQNLQEMAISLRSISDMFSGTQKEASNEQAKSHKELVKVSLICSRIILKC